MSQRSRRPLKLSTEAGWRTLGSSLICPLDGKWGSECFSELPRAQGQLKAEPGLTRAQEVLPLPPLSMVLRRLQRVRGGVGEAPGLPTPIYRQQLHFVLFYKMGLQGSVWPCSITPQSTYWKPISYIMIQSTDGPRTQSKFTTCASTVSPSHLWIQLHWGSKTVFHFWLGTQV